MNGFEAVRSRQRKVVWGDQSFSPLPRPQAWLHQGECLYWSKRLLSDPSQLVALVPIENNRNHNRERKEKLDRFGVVF